MNFYYLFPIFGIFINFGLIIFAVVNNFWLEHLLFVLLLPFLFHYLTSYFSLLFWRDPCNSNKKAMRAFLDNGWNNDCRLIITYLSKGINAECLEESLLKTLKCITKYPINFEIEVVTDIPIHFSSINNKSVTFVVVPEDFITPQGSLFKARASQYAIIQRNERYSDLSNKWILHLDEESILDISALAGINEFINSPKTINNIGQGEIQYNAKNYGKNLIPTVVDSVRTTHDLGFFRFQYKLLKAPLIGIHGSFLLIPANVENQVGFDWGPESSVTEDLAFGLQAYQAGFKFGWINGFIREQSPLSIVDIIKQRKRWINGISLILIDKRYQLKYRLILASFLGLWRIALFSTIALFIYSLNTAGNLAFITCFLFLMNFICFQYLLGAYRNLKFIEWEYKQKVIFMTKVLLLSPLCVLIETVSLIYALLCPSKEFYIIRKL